MGTLNSDISIGADKARFFPVGATDVFRTYWSPGERITRRQPAWPEGVPHSPAGPARPDE
jgi:hypothetical protein